MISQSDLRCRDGALVENWYVACLSHELGVNSTLKRQIYDSPLVLFRAEGGRPACLPDRCLHRHAQLSKGVILHHETAGTCLACPYHGWVYNSDGLVVEVPSEGSCARTADSTLKLDPLPCVEQDGCIWIWMGKGSPRDPSPPLRFPDRKHGWVSYFMITDFDNEATHLVENFMDVPHTVFVHKTWFRTRAKKSVPISVESRDGSVLVTYDQPQDKIGFVSFFVNPKNEPMKHTDHFFMPNLTRVDYNFGSKNAFIIVSQITPVSKLRSRVYTNIVYRVGFLTKPLEPFFRFYTRQVIEQDVEIMKNQGESFQHDMTCRFQATEADRVHLAIERLREFGQKSDPQAHSFQEKVETALWI